MSESFNTTRYTKLKQTKKPGRTLLVKTPNQLNESTFQKLDGYQTMFFAEKSHSYFVTFTTPELSLNAFNVLKAELGQLARLKFANYRVFFTLNGLENTSDYNMVKQTHSELVTKTSNCNVLYYRLYRKNEEFVGCGDFTLDTKEGFDATLNLEGLKNFTFGNYSGTHYRFNKKVDSVNTLPL